MFFYEVEQTSADKLYYHQSLLGVVVVICIISVSIVVDNLTCKLGAWISRDQTRMTSGGFDLHQVSNCFPTGLVPVRKLCFILPIPNELFSILKHYKHF